MTYEIIKKLEDVRSYITGGGLKATIDETIEYLKEMEETLTSAENNTIVRVDRLLKRKTEIEKLKNDIFCISNERDAWKDIVNTTATEAVKEFAKKLKEKRKTKGEIWDSDIDNLVKEMVGADNG